MLSQLVGSVELTTPKNMASFLEDGQPPVVSCLQSFLYMSGVVVGVDVDIVVVIAVGANTGVVLPKSQEHMISSGRYEHLQ